MSKTAGRCPWAVGDVMASYHDNEWGRPQHDDTKLYEFLILEGAQAGLSWRLILERREGYRRAFSGFDPQAVAGYGPGKVDSLLQDAAIIRNRRKIESAINNAARFLEVQREYGSFDGYIWDLAGAPVRNRFAAVSDIPAYTQNSIRMSKNLKKRGFTFVGPVICYAFMQAVGMVNDHVAGCFLHDA